MSVFVNLPNVLHQTGIILSTWAWLSILPGVVATGRNLQATAPEVRGLVAAALDHRVPLDAPPAKYAAARLLKNQLPPEAGKLLISQISRAGEGFTSA